MYHRDSDKAETINSPRQGERESTAPAAVKTTCRMSCREGERRKERSGSCVKSHVSPVSNRCVIPRQFLPSSRGALYVTLVRSKGRSAPLIRR